MANWTGTASKRWWWNAYFANSHTRPWDMPPNAGAEFCLMLFSGTGAVNGLAAAAAADLTLLSGAILNYQFNGAGYPAGGIPLDGTYGSSRLIVHDLVNDRTELHAGNVSLQNVYQGTGLGVDITDVVLVDARPGPNYYILARWDLGTTYTLSATSPTLVSITMPATGLLRMTQS